MNAVARIVADVGRAYDGEPWHGPSTCELLTSVTPEAAAAHPVPHAHGIWEIVLHLTAWTREVQRRLEGHPAGTPPEGDWPAVKDTTLVAWTQAQTDLRAAHDALVETLEHFPTERLDVFVGSSSQGSEGIGVTFDVMLRGLVQHEVYHAGQIALLRKASLD